MKRDIDNGGYKNFVALKKKYPNLKPMLAIAGGHWDGWADGKKFSQMASKQSHRDSFVRSVVGK